MSPHLDHLCPLSRRCGCLGEEQAGHGAGVGFLSWDHLCPLSLHLFKQYLPRHALSFADRSEDRAPPTAPLPPLHPACAGKPRPGASSFAGLKTMLGAAPAPAAGPAEQKKPRVHQPALLGILGKRSSTNK